MLFQMLIGKKISIFGTSKNLSTNDSCKYSFLVWFDSTDALFFTGIWVQQHKKKLIVCLKGIEKY